MAQRHPCSVHRRLGYSGKWQVDRCEGTGGSLSRLADAQFETAARRLEQAVLCSFWRQPGSDSESGTPSAWLLEPGIRALEVVCRCPPAVAARRFLQRSRHASHQDAVWTTSSLIAQAEQGQSALPLGVGVSISHDTGGDLDCVDLLRRVRAWVATVA